MRGRIPLAAAAWGVLAGLAGTSAGADSLSTTLGSPLAETLHTIDIEIQDGVAVHTVRRALHNDGDDPEEATLDIDLPPGGALTGLRLQSQGSWIDGKLLAAEQASERYWELRQPGEGRPRVVALLSWSNLGSGTLKVFPIEGKKTVTLEYSVTAPVRARDGRIWLAVPRWEGTGFVRPEVRVEGVSDLRRARDLAEVPELDVDDDPGGDSMSSQWYSASLAEFAPPMAEVRARYATLTLVGGRSIWRLELDAPTAWGAPPVGARVVFVLDASRSEGRAGIDAQLALVRGYLSQLPDAQAEIVLFRRRAARLFGEFVAAPDFGGALDEVLSTSFVPGNGSSVEAGLTLAAEALAGWTGPARIVVMSDEMFRVGYDANEAAKSLAAAPAGTIVHGVVRSATGGGLAEQWLPDSALMPVARGTGGTVVGITGDDPDPGELARVTRGLVLPIRIDGFGVYAVGAPAPEDGEAPAVFGDAEGTSWPTDLREGVGVRRMQIVPVETPAPDKVVLSGWLWGKEWTRELAVSAPLAQKLPALTFGHPIEESLQDEEGQPLAMQAGAVSRWTSYLAEQKKAEPSTAGYEDGAIGCYGSSGSGSFTCGTHCGIGCSGYIDVTRFVAILRARIEPAVAACARRAGRPQLNVSLRVETTFQEIVDAGVSGHALSPPLEACVEDAVWAAQLDSRFYWSSRSFEFEVTTGDGDDAPAEPPPVQEKGWLL